MAEQSETKHTAGELSIVASDTLFTMVSEDGMQVAKTSWHGSIRKTYPLRGEAHANAARIVLTWNCHDELVAALQAIDLARTTDSPEHWARATVLSDAALAKATSPTA